MKNTTWPYILPPSVLSLLPACGWEGISGHKMDFTKVLPPSIVHLMTVNTATWIELPPLSLLPALGWNLKDWTLDVALFITRNGPCWFLTTLFSVFQNTIFLFSGCYFPYPRKLLSVSQDFIFHIAGSYFPFLRTLFSVFLNAICIL